LAFDHILSGLQGELQKSHETGVELHNFTDAMNDIHDTLGGSLLSPTFGLLISCLNYPSSSPIYHLTHPHSKQSAPALTELQTQLHHSQPSLASHVDKVCALEEVISEHDAIKREIHILREEEFGGASAEVNDDDLKSIRTPRSA
jgi:hypothetical protein